MNEVKPKITLREVRARFNLTQAELGEKLGVSKQTVNSWENGYTMIPSKKLIVIYQLFGIRASDLLGA